MASDNNSIPKENPAVRNDNGQVIVRVSLILTMYFQNGFDLEVRQRIGECLEFYRTLSEGHLLWMHHPDVDLWQRIDPPAVQAFHEWLRTGVPDYSWTTSWRGGRNPHEASDFQFNVLAKEGPLPELSFLQIVLPMNSLETPRGTFPQVALRLSQILKPYHGYGGYGFAESSDIAVRDEAQPLIYSMARRFPGLEVDRPVIHIDYLNSGIKGVNWLTILGPSWIEAIGGVTRLRASLSEQFVFHEYDESVMIQAGTKPQIGDRNQRLWPKLYLEIARLLKPIRCRKRYCFDNYGDNRFTKETSEQWLERFDNDPLQ